MPPESTTSRPLAPTLPFLTVVCRLTSKVGVDLRGVTFSWEVQHDEP